jgi:hypothetical protein
MIRPFQMLKQFLNFFEMRQSQLYRLHDKWFSDRVFRGCQAQPQEAIDHLLERLAGFARLFVEQAGHVVIKSKSGSHIMMLVY